VEETGISVSLVPANPSLASRTFSPPNGDAKRLTISYLSSRVFTILLLCPSAQHALLLGTSERIFFASSAELFYSTFAAPSQPNTTPISRRQQMRNKAIGTALPLAIPARHALDTTALVGSCVSAAIIWTLLFLDRFEEWVFRVARARPVRGLEPWKQWERAARAHGGETIMIPRDPAGSVRRA
jgi:hypothetical protein